MEDTHSEFIEIVRPDGKVIRGLIEVSSAANDSQTPVVLIVPPYARTIRDMFFAGLYLIRNGFRTIRYDSTNHIGASDGDIFDYTLSSTLQDFTSVLATVRSRYPKASLGVFATSLGARIAFRALAEEKVGLLVSLVGVVHVQDTLRRVLGRDFVEERLNERLTTNICEVLGYSVGRQFIEDIVRADWYSRESTTKEVAACGFPVVDISTEQDDWTHLPDVNAVFAGNGNCNPRELFVIPGSSHHLEKNPSAARLALVQAIASLKRYVTGEEVENAEIRCPNFVELVRKNKHERHLEKIGYRAG